MHLGVSELRHITLLLDQRMLQPALLQQLLVRIKASLKGLTVLVDIPALTGTVMSTIYRCTDQLPSSLQAS